MARKKPLRDVDSAERAFFLRIASIFIRWGLIVLPLFIYKFGWLGLVFWFLVCMTLSIIIELITDRFGSMFGRIYTGRNSGWTVQERLRGAMDIAKVQKANGEYDAAMLKIEEILARDPCFAEALYVKAQILYEGYGETGEALHCLEKVFAHTKVDDPLRRWAFMMKKQINF